MTDAAAISGILRSGAAGAMVGVWSIVNAVAFATLVFSGPLAPQLVLGVSAALLGYVVSAVALALFSRLPGMASGIIAPSVAVYAAFAAIVVDHLARSGVSDPVVQAQSVLVANALLTLIAGVMLLLLGVLRLGALGRWLPYPVVVGFNAGVGWIFVLGGWSLATGASVTPEFLRSMTPGDLLRSGLAVVLATSLLLASKRIPHWSVTPGLLVGSVIAFHLFRAADGFDLAAAQTQHWVFGPFPPGRSFAFANPFSAHWPDLAGSKFLSFAAANVFLAAFTLILSLGGLETELRKTIAPSRELVIAGFGNILAAATGGFATGQSASNTIILYLNHAANRVGTLTPAAMAAAVIFAGPTVLTTLPRFVVAALLISVGLELLVVRIWRACALLPWHESAIAVAVALAIATLGVIDGLALGLLSTVLFFAWNYRKVPVVRMALTGAACRSSSVRSAEAVKRLSASGAGTAIYRLQGYLFFLNATSLRAQIEDRIVTAQPPLHHLVLDFKDIVGMDGSAFDAFGRICQIAQDHEVAVCAAELSPDLTERFASWNLLGAAAPQMRSFATLDHALEQLETEILSEPGQGLQPRKARLSAMLAPFLSADRRAENIERYIDRLELEPGTFLVRQGGPADALYFVESGEVVTELERPNAPPLRLQKTEAGAIIGEIAVYRGGRRTASVRAETPCAVVRIAVDALERMRRDDPDIARALEAFIIAELAEKLADTNRRLQQGQL